MQWRVLRLYYVREVQDEGLGEVLYDEATGDYSMNQRHYVIDLCKKYLPLGGARVQTPMSEETLTKEMSPTTDQQKLEMTKIP